MDKQTSDIKEVRRKEFLVSEKLLVALLLFSSMGLVSAIEDPTFQVNTGFDLKRTCDNFGFFCDAAVDCNITIIKSNGELMINDVNMTFNTTFRNITVTPPQNDQLGFAKATMGCANATNGGIDTFDIVITADGNPWNQFPQQFFIIILGLAFITLGVAKERLRMFKYLGAVIFMVMGVLTLFPGYGFINWTTLMGKVLGFVLIGLGFFFLIEDGFARDEQDERYTQEDEDERRFFS